ncbi:MAG TPA: hypothetical protein VF950_26585 [Planctomycetota bacterium]
MLLAAATAVAIPGFKNRAILGRENQAKERLRSGVGETPGYVLVASPIGKQAVPERYGDTGRYTFFTHPDHGVLKLDTGGKIVEKIPSDAELRISRPPPRK